MSRRMRAVMVWIVGLLAVAWCGLYFGYKSLQNVRSVAEMEMISIPAGSFLMGNSGVGDDKNNANPEEFPQHKVTLSAYKIGKYEVTRGQYREFIEAGGYSNRAYWSTEGWKYRAKDNRTEPYAWGEAQTWFARTFLQADKRPVEGVNYYEAEAFCKWAGGHLPTEAQWERAARWDAEKKHPNIYPWGDEWDASKCKVITSGCGFKGAPVGSYPSGASPCGCDDMAGNVVEWCQDWHADDYYSKSPTKDPQGPTSGKDRAMRGGGWFGDDKDGGRCAFRFDYNYPGNSLYGHGFRLAR